MKHLDIASYCLCTTISPAEIGIIRKMDWFRLHCPWSYSWWAVARILSWFEAGIGVGVKIWWSDQEMKSIIGTVKRPAELDQTNDRLSSVFTVYYWTRRWLWRLKWAEFVKRCRKNPHKSQISMSQSANSNINMQGRHKVIYMSFQLATPNAGTSWVSS